MKTAFLTLIIGCICFLTPSSSAQDRGGRDRGGRDRGNRQNEYEGYLKRLDQNGDGYLAENEMSGRTKRWLGEMGIDTNRRVKISSVSSTIQRRERDRQRGELKSEKDKNFATQIPGFFDIEFETEELPGFGIEYSNVAQVDIAEKQYSREILDQVEGSFRRYDKDKNGILDKNEIAAARWGSPPATDSDLNKDGQLTKAELAERYKRRQSSNQSNNRGGNRSPSNSGNRFSNNRTSNRSFGGNSSRSSGSRSTGSLSNRSSGSSSSSGTDYTQYVQGVMDRYDKDKDGILNAAEIKTMSRAPKGADKDGDGSMSFDELVNHYSGANSESDDKNSDDKSSGDRGTRTTSRGGTGRGSTGGRTPRPRTFSFSGNDANRDGQIEMSEFTQEWTDELLAEFNKLDLNGDGYITQPEHQLASKTNTDGKTGGTTGTTRRFGRDNGSTNGRTSRFGRNRNNN